MMKKLRCGSLFDGISGFLLVAQRLGFEPVWASEIEKVPISISKRHFPEVLHLGDITKINGAEIEPVELVCFGSPCQDLSIAGKGEGLAGERSGLFNHAIRIIREMRVATDGLYPRYAVWENVPGAFSSNGGQDFRTVLESFGEAEIPMPDSGKWAPSGMVEFPECRVFWRQLDAQYWGVPQRRKRIFLVADFTGKCGPEILFEPEGVRGYFTESGTAREEAARIATQGVGKQVIPLNTQIITRSNKLGRNTGFGAGEVGAVAYTIQESHHHAVCLGFVSNASIANNAPVLENKTPTMGRTNDMAVACLSDQGGSSIGVEKEDVSPTLRSESHGNLPVVAIDCRNDSVSLVSGTLQAKPNGGQSLNFINPVMIGKVASTLRAGAGAPKHEADFEGRLVIQPVAVFDKAQITSKQNASKVNFDLPSPPVVSTGGLHAINYMGFRGYGDYKESEVAKALLRCDDITTSDLITNNYQVRRLTPVECERLQGFPDGWTEFGIDEIEVLRLSEKEKRIQYPAAWEKGMKRLGLSEGGLLEYRLKKISDSARYKALGNSVAIPCVEYVMGKVKKAWECSNDN